MRTPQNRTHHVLKNLPHQKPETRRREEHVIMLHRQGMTRAEIAAAVNLSPKSTGELMTCLRLEGRL